MRIVLKCEPEVAFIPAFIDGQRHTAQQYRLYQVPVLPGPDHFKYFGIVLCTGVQAAAEFQVEIGQELVQVINLFLLGHGMVTK